MGTGYKWQMYSELQNKDFVRMCKGALPMNEPLLHKIHKIHWSQKVNNIINLPFKKIWFKKMTNGNFNNDKPTCFVLFYGQYGIREPKLLDYIKEINPENKIAVHYLDLIIREEEHIDMLKNKTDLIYSYNKQEVEKYGIEYFCTNIYSRTQKITTPKSFKYDLYFIGHPKGRLDYLLQLCKYLTEKKVKCMFKIAGVPRKERIKQNGIVYLNKPIPYPNVEKDIQDTRCILELLQPGSDGATMRCLEATAYKRKLLTNGPDISNRMFFCDAQMKSFSDFNEIDIDFLTSPLPYEHFLSVDSFSPMREIYFLEDYFSNTTQDRQEC